MCNLNSQKTNSQGVQQSEQDRINAQNAANSAAERTRQANAAAAAKAATEAAAKAAADAAAQEATAEELKRRGRRRGGISTVISGASGDPNFGSNVSLAGLTAGPSEATYLGRG